MTRRNGNIMKYISIGFVVLLCFYGLYSYHDVHTRLKTAEEKVDRLRQQHDSVSAQMQVVYEHKTRLENSLQQEKADHQRTKDEFKEQQTQEGTKHESEKSDLMNRIDSINQENKMLQSQVEDQQNEITKLKEDLTNVQSDAQQKDVQHNEEYLQFKQEKEFEITKLKDEVSNMERKNQELQQQVNIAVQRQAESLQMRNNVQHNLDVNNQQQPEVNRQQYNHVENNVNNNVQQFHQQEPQYNNQLQQQQYKENNIPQGNIQINQDVQRREEEMQIAQPGAKKPYFEPKNEGIDAGARVEIPEQNEDNEQEAGGKLVNEQVAPPKLQNADPILPNSNQDERNKVQDFNQLDHSKEENRYHRNQENESKKDGVNFNEEGNLKQEKEDNPDIDRYDNINDKAKLVGQGLQGNLGKEEGGNNLDMGKVENKVLAPHGIQASNESKKYVIEDEEEKIQFH